MKLSCLPVSYFTQIISGEMSIKDWAYQGAELGLDAIDLSILFIDKRTPCHLDKLRREIESAGVQVSMVTTYPDFTHPDSVQRQREGGKCRDDIVTAARLGAELVRVTAGQAHPATGREQGLNWAVEGLTQMIETTQKYDVTLVFENHTKPGVWEYVDFSHPTDIFLEIVDRTADTSLGINWDTANTLAYGDDPIPVLERVLDRVTSVHVADIAVRGEFRPVQIGTGVVPLREIFSILKGAGFCGWICIEEASFQGKTGIKAAVAFVRKSWEEA